MNIKSVRFYFYLRKHEEFSKKYFNEIQFGDAKKALSHLRESLTYRRAYMKLANK